MMSLVLVVCFQTESSNSNLSFHIRTDNNPTLENEEVCISVYLLFIFQLKKEISLYTNDI